MKAINPVEVKDTATGHVDVRNGVTLAFFIEDFVYQCGEALTAAFDLFVARTPQDTLQWAVVNATSEQWREMDATVMKRLRDSLAPAGARKRKFTAFRVNDFGDGAPQYGFTLSERDKDEEMTRSLTLVQMTFPPDVANEEQSDSLCDLIAEFTALLKPVSGYCSPSLLPSDSRQSAAFAAIRSFALRYPGYDVAMNDMTQLDIGNRVRGARWVSLLGHGIQEQLGGIDTLRKLLPSQVQVREVSGVAMIRAGKTPELGDVNRKLDTPLLRAVARVLEPVTLFGEVDLLSHFADFDDDLLRRWERRFLD